MSDPAASPANTASSSAEGLPVMASPYVPPPSDAPRMALRTLGRDAQAAANALQAHLPTLEAQAMEGLRQRGWQPDYLTVRRREDLQSPQPGDALVVLGAARLGNTRLIDNFEI